MEEGRERIVRFISFFMVHVFFFEEEKKKKSRKGLGRESREGLMRIPITKDGLRMD